MLRGVILGLDGVIFGTERMHYLAWKEALSPLGVKVSQTAIDSLHGLTRNQSLERLLSGSEVVLSPYEKGILCAHEDSVYQRLTLCVTPDDAASGARDVLQRLRQLHVATAVCSASKNARAVLDRLQLTELVDYVVDGSYAGESGALYMRAAERLNAAPQQCIAVLADVCDVDVANKLGFVTAGIGAAAAYEGCDHSLCELRDLLPLC